MLEKIKTQTQTTHFNRISQPACEISQFMKNFFEVAHEGNEDEVSTYYADDMDPLQFPLNADWSDETLIVDDHLATFACTLRSENSPDLRLTCVLDKSEGYWQIIHGEVHESAKH